MKRVLVYSHDTFGLGNIRRMLAICEHLIETDPALSVLLITGSPVIHELRLPPRLDYIKLPCLTRTAFEGYEAKYLGTEIGETMRLRADLILSAVANYKPDLLLVDKKPYGVKNELLHALHYAQLHLPTAQTVLVLRDILDSPERTQQVWRKNGYDDAIRNFYDHVVVLGEAQVFDLPREYALSAAVTAKVTFCSYLGRQPADKSRWQMRAELGLSHADKFILATPGGGQDGFTILSAYLDSLALLPPEFHSLIVSGPELPASQRELLAQKTALHPRAKLIEFTRDMPNLMNAADAVVAMGGYNTVCELLSLRKRAVIVPRTQPAQEQLIRAERLAARGLFEFIHPDQLTPARMQKAVSRALDGAQAIPLHKPLDMGALPRLTALLGIRAPIVTKPKSLRVPPIVPRFAPMVAARAAD